MPNKLRFALFALLSLCLFPAPSHAVRYAREIDANVDVAIDHFKMDVPSAKAMLEKAKGVLVFPKVYKGGIGLGAEYGVGALRIDGKSVEYYNTMAGSIGFQLGGQRKTIFILFMEEESLKRFRASDGWKAGVDGSIAVVKLGAEGSFDTFKTDQPIIAYVVGQRGLMYNLTLEGSKFNKIVAVK